MKKTSKKPWLDDLLKVNKAHIATSECHKELRRILEEEPMYFLLKDERTDVTYANIMVTLDILVKKMEHHMTLLQEIANKINIK